MSFRLMALNWKGIEGLLSGVSRCWALVSVDYFEYMGEN